MAIRKASRQAAMDRARAINPALFDRLMSKVDASQPQECWPTTLSKDACGYSTIKAGGRNIKSHRAMHGLFYPHADAPIVRHICNNPACINPVHLRAGTQRDNAADRVAFGRGGDLRGANNGRAKLTDEQVFEILSSKEVGTLLAAKHGVSKNMISRIRRGLAWSHISTKGE